MNNIVRKRIEEFINKISDTILAALSKDYSADFKAKLISLLSHTGLKNAENTVIRHLQQNANQEEAILAACRFHNEEVYEFIISRLKDPRAAHRDIMAEQLGFIDDDGVFKVLNELLSDADRHVRFQAANSLFNKGGKDAALALCQYISDPDEWISMTILRLLCIMKEHETIPILIEKFHQDNDLRRKALMVSFLSRFNSVTLINIFDEGIRGLDARLKANSIEAIGNLNLPHDEIKARVEPFLRDPNNRIRANAILALAKSEPETVRIEIEEMVISNDVQLRRSAAFIIGMMHSEGFEAFAEKLLSDPVDAVRTRMVASLKNFPSEFVCKQLEAVLSDPDKWIRKYAVDMASRITSFPTDKILSLLKTERAAPNLEACIKFFITHPSEDALTALKLHVKDRRLPVVKALLEAVSAINGLEGIEAIAPRLDSRNPKVIDLLTQAMLNLGQKKAIESLINKFSKLTKEHQLKNLVPSIEACLVMFKNPAQMPEILIESLSHIEVVEVPPAPVEIPEEVSSTSASEEEKEVDAVNFLGTSENESGEKPGDNVDSLLDLDSFISDTPNTQIEEGLDMGLPNVDVIIPTKPVKKASSHYRKGVKAYNLGKYSRAYKAFNAALEEDVEKPVKIYFYMGLVAYELEKYNEAKDYLEKYLVEKPTNVRSNYVVGKVYKELKNWKKLIVAYTKFTTGEIEAPAKLTKRIYYELGIANILVGNNKEGDSQLSRVRKVMPTNVEVMYYMAFARFNMGKPSAASALISELLESKPKNERIKKLAEVLEQKIRSGGH